MLSLLCMFILCIFLQLLAALNLFQSPQSIQLTWQILCILQLRSEFIGWYFAQPKSSAQCMVYTVGSIHCHSTLLPLSLATWFEGDLNIYLLISCPNCAISLANALCYGFHHIYLTSLSCASFCINWYLATSCIISPICMFRHHDIYWVSLIQPQFSHNILFYFIFLHQIWTEQVLMQCCPLLKPLFIWIKPLQNHSLSTTRARRQMWSKWVFCVSGGWWASKW